MVGEPVRLGGASWRSVVVDGSVSRQHAVGVVYFFAMWALGEWYLIGYVRSNTLGGGGG